MYAYRLHGCSEYTYTVHVYVYNMYAVLSDVINQKMACPYKTLCIGKC